MDLETHRACLAEAKKLREDNPELYAEYKRRRLAGEWFKPEEPVTAFMRKLTALDRRALSAIGY